MSAEVELGNEAPSLSSTEHRARNVTKDDWLQMKDAGSDNALAHWHRQARKPRKREKKTQHNTPLFIHFIPSLVDSTAGSRCESMAHEHWQCDRLFPSRIPGDLGC